MLRVSAQGGRDLGLRIRVRCSIGAGGWGGFSVHRQWLCNVVERAEREAEVLV